MTPTSSDTVVVHYLWRLLVSDPDEWDVHRDLKDIYVRSSSEYLEFRVETSEGWASSYIEPDSSGIDVAFFIDIDRNPATGKTTVMNGTIPINDIGAEYRFIIGYHGDSLALWIPDPDPGAWQPLGQVDYLAIADGSYFFEVGIHLSRLSGPYIFDLVVANYTWNSVQSMFKWDWVPDQDSGHVSYEVDHSFEGSPPANMTPECDRTSTDAKRLRTTPFE